MNLRGVLFALLSFCLLTPTVSVFAQTAPTRPDSTKVVGPPENPEGRIIKTEKDKGLSKPGRAALYSAIIPGAGQFYNKHYWKVPVIYVVGGTIGYFIVSNDQSYQEYQKAYKYSIDNDANTVPMVELKGKPTTITSAAALNGRNYYRRNRDLSIIIAFIAYGLQVMEANVGAHLNDFDVSDDLSLNWQPQMINVSQPGFRPAPGLSFNFRLKSK